MIQKPLIPTGKTAVITVGLPGCGKSTVARKMSNWENPVCFKVIERDMLRNDLWTKAFPKERFKWGSWPWSLEPEVTKMHGIMLAKCMKTHNHIVLSDTWLNGEHRKNIINNIMENGYEVTVMFFDIPIEVCKERNLQRAYPVPEVTFIKLERHWWDYKKIMIKESEALNYNLLIVPVTDEVYEYKP